MSSNRLTFTSDTLDLLRKAEYTVSVHCPHASKSVRGNVEVAGIGWFRVGGQLFKEDLIESFRIYPHDQFAVISMGGVKPKRTADA